MKRAILVSSGTLAGLVAVLTYSGADVPAAVASGPTGSNALGGPPPIGADPAASPTASGAAPAASGSPAASASAKPAPSAKPAASAKPSTSAAAAKPGATPTPAAPAPAASSTAPAPAASTPAPKPTPAAPKPTPTPASTGPKDFTGSYQTHKYGSVQVGIRVQNGKIIAVWPVVYPNGPSQPYSDFSIPVLKQETLSSQGHNIANVSGATLTWQSWKASLSAAMAQAGI